MALLSSHATMAASRDLFLSAPHRDESIGDALNLEGPRFLLIGFDI